jgi:glucan biosynthesis protein C
MPEKTNRNLWVDYLRSALTVLVVAHHSSLAYTTFAKFDKAAYINSTHAIVDGKRWIGLDIFENFNDVFFMSLMFLIGGLFLTKSITKKGMLTFITDRVLRLFIPFLFLGTFFMFMAYFPSYHIAHENMDIAAYVKDFFTTEQWPVGPPWFIWVLFVFNLLFVFIHKSVAGFIRKTGDLLSGLQHKPALFFLLMFGFTWLLYVPVAYRIGAGTWAGFGPFDFQLSRILLYFGYFLSGVVIGNADFNTRIFSIDSFLVKLWWLWALLAVMVYTLLTLNGIYEPLRKLVGENKLEAFNAWMIYYSVYVASCTLSTLAFITVFRKFVHARVKWWDSLVENAYLIYLVHYIFVTWTQFLLLDVQLTAFLKFVIVFAVALGMSWSVSILLRKFSIVKKYL